MKTVAVVGAGFCGLAVTWELLQNNCHVHLYDVAGVGAGASGVSAGLLHPFVGMHAKLAKEGHEGVQATKELLHVASEAIGKPAFEYSGMLRLAVTEEMAADFQLCAKLHRDGVWWNAEECQNKVVGLAPFPGLWFEKALTVHSSHYLQGLWIACEQQGATLLLQSIHSLNELSHYDHVLLTMGAATGTVSKVPLNRVKGQLLELAWPTVLPPLAVPVNGQAYILMQPGNRSCLVGATYERNFSSPAPDPDVAMREILPKVTALLPALKGAPILNCRAGVRASAPGHQPLLKQIDAKTWVLAGMGSKGLLYHALFAKKLCRVIF